MTVAASSSVRRRWLAPEVVQTSAMDCGPAALKCLLEGFHIPVSYGRLREACQTDVDGTSIDTIEEVAGRLGVPMEQMLIPADHLLIDSVVAVPGIVVVRHRAGTAHFVVVWRRHGDWLQVMDPAIGRRWVRCRRFVDELFRHTQSVPASQWREWVAGDDHLGPLRQRLRDIGVTAEQADGLITASLNDPGWRGMATLDAAIRLVASVRAAGGVRTGEAAGRLLGALVARVAGDAADLYRMIPRDYWSVTPVPESEGTAEALLQLHGAVVLRVAGMPGAGAAANPAEAEGSNEPRPAPALSPELAAALREKTPHPLRTVWSMIREEGLLAPLALLGALLVAAGGVLIEALLFRGLFDITWMLADPLQRLLAAGALLLFAVLLLCMQIPIFSETLRMGRHLEARLRMALLRKLPLLADRYFHSRPVSDMAERSHSIALTRAVPSIGMNLVQTLFELLLTLTGIMLIDASSALLAAVIALFAVGFALAAQPMLNERDLRVRNHAGALHGFYLDALLGLVPVRTHGAAQAVSRQHEGLLVEWSRSSVGFLRMSLATGGLQALTCTALSGYLLVDHFIRSGGVTGADLLLVYWVLKMPAIGAALSALAVQYPGQRNVVMRLLEPLGAPEDTVAAGAGPSAADHPAQGPASEPGKTPVHIDIRDGRVVAAGHMLLREINLSIRAGEHVAIVGPSGAGKSTLVGLLLGWHRLAGGSLKVDQETLDNSALQDLRREIAWVDPGIQIWNSAFINNIGYAAEDAGIGRLAGVIDSAHLRGVLQKLPRGLQTYLGEGGGLLSGGEGQRIRLARALLQSGVRLALLDEPFRGMDRAQRAALLADARQWWRDTTLLCVTHDVGETLDFNRVLVVDDGRIVEDDEPRKLAACDSLYRSMLDSESRVRGQLWQGKQWRRLALIEGRIVPVETPSSALTS